MPNEKFILTVRELHLGFIKETFRAGAVIEHDEASGRLIVDGRRFDDTRDLDLLKKHGWVVPYSEEAMEVVLEDREIGFTAKPKPKPKPGEGMDIVQSDEDSHETIDISHTQVSKANAKDKEDARAQAKGREKDRKMEIIKGDETVDERIKRLEGKTDMNSVAERVRLKRQATDMPIVKDDSLGVGSSKSEIPMNAGQHLPSREEVEAKTAAAKAAADARKKGVEQVRAAGGIEVPSENAAESSKSGDVKRPVDVTEQIDEFQTPKAAAAETAQTGLEVPKEPVEAPDGLGMSEAAAEVIMAENNELKAENAELKGGMATLMARMDALEAPKTDVPAETEVAAETDGPAEGDSVERTPVTDEAKAEEVIAEQTTEG